MAALHDDTYSRLDTRTIADILGADAQASARAAPPYNPSDEVRPATNSRGPARRRASEVDALLARFVDDALAGVPDRLIGQRTGLAAQQVKQWRARRRIRGRRGRAAAQLGTRFLLASFLGEHTTPVPHEVSMVGGAWSPPAYTLRRPLRYDLFVHAVCMLVADMTTEEIALAIGVDQRDVEIAVTLGTGHGGAS